jgi:hypothetical protein
VLGVYALIVLLILLDFARVEFGSPIVMSVYPGLSLALGFAQAVLLLSAAVGMYLRPMGSNLLNFVTDVAKSRIHAMLTFAFISLECVVGVYFVLFKPYTIVEASTVFGTSDLAMRVSSGSVLLLLVLLVFFLGYPTFLLVKSAQRVQNPVARQGLVVLPIGWALVSILYVVVEVYLWSYGVDFMAPLYLTNAIVFFATTRTFRRSAVIAGFVFGAQPSAVGKPMGQLPKEIPFVIGKTSLLEVDPSLPFERTLREILSQLMSLGAATFVFTPNGSRLHNSLSDLEDVRLFTESGDVSYIKPSDRPNEVIVPANDTGVVLDSIEKILVAQDASKVVIVFDSLSDFILSIGFTGCYNFLKRTLETLGEKGATSIFLIVSGAHEPSTTNLIRLLFANQFVLDVTGLRIVKSQTESISR